MVESGISKFDIHSRTQSLIKWQSVTISWIVCRLTLMFKVQQNGENENEIVQQILRSRCKAETSISTAMIDLVTKRIFQYFQKHLFFYNFPERKRFPLFRLAHDVKSFLKKEKKWINKTTNYQSEGFALQNEVNQIVMRLSFTKLQISTRFFIERANTFVHLCTYLHTLSTLT